MEQVEKWKVVCTGNIESGFSKEDVANNIKILLKINIDEAEALISGISTVVKKDLNQAKASQYVRVLEKAGVQMRMEGMPFDIESGFEALSLVPLEEVVTEKKVPNLVQPQQDREQYYSEKDSFL